jgi:Family of unknown function (DUF5991)
MRLKIGWIFLTVILGFGLSPIATLACGRSTIPGQSSRITQMAQMTQQRIKFTDWQGEYHFTEQVSSKPGPSDVNYTIRISAVRCMGVFPQITIQGPSKSMIFHTEAIAIDANTIGLYFLSDRSKAHPHTPRFKPDDLLLRIQRKTLDKSDSSIAVEPTYYVYFEQLSPVIPNHKSKALEIPPPLRRPPR